MNTQHKPTCLIVGGTGHIGRGISLALASAGSKIAVASRQMEVLQKFADGFPYPVYTVPADFTNPESVHTCVSSVKEHFGELHCIVYSVGIPPDPDVPLADYPISDWKATLNTYLTGFFFTFQEAMRVLPRDGHLLAIGSAVTRIPEDRLPEKLFVGHYAAAKAGLDEFCKWARREAHERGILLSRLAPGAVDVPFHREAPPHRKPAATLSIEEVAQRVATALLDGNELNESMIAGT